MYSQQSSQARAAPTSWIGRRPHQVVMYDQQEFVSTNHRTVVEMKTNLTKRKMLRSCRKTHTCKQLMQAIRCASAAQGWTRWWDGSLSASGHVQSAEHPVSCKASLTIVKSVNCTVLRHKLIGKVRWSSVLSLQPDACTKTICCTIHQPLAELHASSDKPSLSCNHRWMPLSTQV